MAWKQRWLRIHSLACLISFPSQLLWFRKLLEMFEKVAHPAAFFLDWPEVSSSLQKKAERQEGRKEQGKSQTCTILGPGTDTCAMFCINGIFGMSGVFRCTEN